MLHECFEDALIMFYKITIFINVARTLFFLKASLEISAEFSLPFTILYLLKHFSETTA